MDTTRIEQSMDLAITAKAFLICCIGLTGVLFSSCTPTKMSLDEARNVSVSMQETAFVPPPRGVDDILSLLKNASFDGKATLKYAMQAEKEVPQGASEEALRDFYFKRGKAARRIGRVRQALDDLRKAYALAEKTGDVNPKLYGLLGSVEAPMGNMKEAIGHVKRSLRTKRNTPSYKKLTKLYLSIGDLKKAEEVQEEGVRFCEFFAEKKRKRNPGKSSMALADAASMKAVMLEARGKYKKAEKYLRKQLKIAQRLKQGKPLIVPNARLDLAQNLINQHREIEAEMLARKALREALRHAGSDSAYTSKALRVLSKSILKQGRFAGAEKLVNAEIKVLRQAGASESSYAMSRAYLQLARVLAVQKKFTQAVYAFDQAKKAALDNPLSFNPLHVKAEVILALLEEYRFEEAMGYIEKSYDKMVKVFGESHGKVAKVRALRAVAYSLQEKQALALNDFSQAVPVLLKPKSSAEKGKSSSKVKQYILEHYIDLLSQIDGTDIEQNLDGDAVAIAFQVADFLRGGSVQGAISESSARNAAKDPELAGLVRSEQDIRKQIDTLQGILVNSLANPEDQLDTSAIDELKSQVKSLRGARSALLDEIEVRFPKYTSLITPKPLSLDETKSVLSKDEALISIYSSEEKTYVWAIMPERSTEFHVVDFGEYKLNKDVRRIRRSLDPENVEFFKDIPNFDLSLANGLYKSLLAPVEQGWKGSKDLYIVANGALGRLPFSLLPTKIDDFEEKETVLFERYKSVSWLVREVSVARLPSVSAFATLRSIAEPEQKGKRFIGFGDPIFNQEQLHQNQIAANTIAQRGKGGVPVKVRGLRVTNMGDLDDEIESVGLNTLNRLPDTAEEILSIAGALGANINEDIFLETRASEKQVKSMDLSDRQIVAFASHALVPGDLDGLDQPAIALSSPDVTGEDEDGLLTMGEILKLNLNAEWVVLSACNTGAAEGSGSEAVSGLGRSFFYAGTRAILVSMWPVETSSARKLTTQLFQNQVDDTTLPRSRALQQSMIQLIDNQGITDPLTGTIVASYAHPMFWAPFIVVGENGTSVSVN